MREPTLHQIWNEHQRAAASAALSFTKLSKLVPCKVKCNETGYESKVIRVVFDPTRVDEVNRELNSEGYIIRRGLAAVAINEDESVLAWRYSILSNTIHYTKKWEEIDDYGDKVAFNDVQDLFDCLGIKNTKRQVDAVLQRLKNISVPHPRG